MPNLSQLKRERMLAFLQKIKDEHRDDDEMLIALGEIESELTAKKYGLVWEQHEEAVDVMMRDNIPVFTEVPEREIAAAPDQGYNFILEGDNLHSLRLLEKTHKGKVDVIYIDPPYNTGNKDFVYDDAYVDNLDGFRHSKWISFMSERLKIARNLLTNDGVIAISIGYQEVHNLVVLCQEMFDTKQVTCVTVQTSGGKPNGGFNYVQEYLVFIAPRDFEPSTMNFTGGIERSPFEGLTLSTFTKVTRPNQAYPIFIDKKTMNIDGVVQIITPNSTNGQISLPPLQGYETVLYLTKWERDQLAFCKQMRGVFQQDEKQDFELLFFFAEKFDKNDGTDFLLCVLEFIANCATQVNKECASFIKRLQKGSTDFSRITKHSDLGILLQSLYEQKSCKKIMSVLKWFYENKTFKFYRKELYFEMMRSLKYAHEHNGTIYDAAMHIRNDPMLQKRYADFKFLSSRALLSKGLEFDCVIIDTSKQLTAKEFYVAMTRAKRMIYIISDKATLNLTP